MGLGICREINKICQEVHLVRCASVVVQPAERLGGLVLNGDLGTRS
jgi:hypothetical protein